LISFPRGTKMLQFPRFDLHYHCNGVHKSVRFSFGNLGIVGCMRLPRAYRSLPRPSSLLKPSNPPIAVFTPAISATYYTTMHDDHCKSSGEDPLHPSYITFMMHCIDDFCEDVCAFQHNSLSKEVIRPQVPLRSPCYDFSLVAYLKFDNAN
jgi:hypothetical protein